METQAGLFSAVLTAFIIDSKQNLKVSPQDQMVYYLQQNVAMLDQISRQISSIAPQLSIPSTPPSPFPTFKPSASNIRVNVFWFMALIFSLCAALLATLVQQWVRDYMHVFQRYSDPLKRARLRQYLHEGSEGWLMPVVSEAVPGLLHVSLFLFFVGLCDFVLNTNTKVGVSTTTPIAITGLLYVFTTVAPVMNPQSPYQNSFSGLIWYAIQKFGGRQYKDRGPRGAPKSVSSNMAEGQMQLAMEESEDREGRDERAIRWLVSSMTEDAEMDSFVMAIPGSFNEEWGVDVWKKVSFEDRNRNTSRNEPGPSPMQRIFYPFIHLVRSCTASGSRPTTAALPPVPHPPSPYPPSTSAHTQGEDTVRELSTRVGHLLDTCKNQGLFATIKLWRRRTRACVETTASLVCCVGAELSHFGDMVKLLGDIGSDQTVRESSLVGKEQSFVMRWTCLSLVAIRPILESESESLLRNDAKMASQQLERRDNTGPGQSPTRLEKIIETFDQALKCLEPFSGLPIWGGDQTEERVKEILLAHESHISELEKIDIENAGYQLDDWSISSVQQSIDRITHGIITCQLPGVKSDVYDTESIHFSQFIELFRDPHALLFIFPLRNLTRIRTFAETLRKILNGQIDVDTFRKTIKDLREFVSLSTWSVKPDQPDKVLRRQVWRLQDLSGGGLGFTVELFFLALKQLLSTSSSKESHSELYIGTFRAITARGSDYRASPGTQKLLLDMVVPYRGIIFDFDYPNYIVTAFLEFLGSILEGHTGDQHINDVVEQLEDATDGAVKPRHRALSIEALGFIRARTPSS
jgi:hypothetical protein